jgi:hypothetical protein
MAYEVTIIWSQIHPPIVLRDFLGNQDSEIIAKLFQKFRKYGQSNTNHILFNNKSASKRWHKSEWFFSVFLSGKNEIAEK